MAMKRFFLFPLLLLFFWGCQKATFEYAVICEFPPVFSREGGTTLVITDDQGDIAGHFPISTSSTSFNQKFTFKARNASEKFGLHLISEASVFSSDNYFSIYSHCGVPNGASVTLNPENFASFRPRTFRLIPVLISGITSLDSFLVFNQPYYFEEPKKGVLFTDIFVQTSQTQVIRIFANGEKEERTLWLRESMTSTDTVRVNFNDLNIGYNVSNIDIQFPADLTYYSASVDMVSPDFKDFIRLAITNRNPEASRKLSVAKPNIIPNDWLVYVNFSDNYSSSEQLFKPGEPLIITRPTDFGIISAATEPGQSISVKTSGEVDLIRATTYLTSPDGQRVNWSIDGDTETFKYLELPELKRFLPNTDLYDQAFKDFNVSLFNINGFDYEQVRRGFPWRSGEIYPAGRSNLRIIRKVY